MTQAPAGPGGQAPALLASLRPVVLASLAIEFVNGLLVWPEGIAQDLYTVLTVVQFGVISAAVTALLWLRTRTAIVLSVATAVLALVFGAAGYEPWLIVVAGIMAGARGSRTRLWLTVSSLLAYSVAYALRAESFQAGWGLVTGLVLVSLVIVSLVVGLVAGRFLRAARRRREHERELQRASARLRTAERNRIAHEVEAVVTAGLARITAQAGAASDGTISRRSLRHELDRIERQCRSSLDQLRDLLGALRAGEELRSWPARRASRPADRPGLWAGLLASPVRLVTVAVLVALAVRYLPGAAGTEWALATAGLGVLGWIAALLNRPLIAAGCAAVALAASTAGDPEGLWQCIPAVLLAVLAGARLGVRGLWFTIGGFVVHWTIVTALHGFAQIAFTLTSIAAVVGFTSGLTVGVLRRAHTASTANLRRLRRERDQAIERERTEAARELHDVVGHQLTVIAMRIMAAADDEDPAALNAQLGRIRQDVAAAGHELAVLLHALRADDLDPTPLVNPVRSGAAMAARLRESGFDPDLRIDPAVGALPPATQRTLARVMQEATTNILRHSPPGSTCGYLLEVAQGQVRLAVTSPLPVEPVGCDDSAGWGLQGIRERIELCGGGFHAGPEAGTWTVRVSLPLSEAVLTRQPAGR